jgi:hypothetical protein
VDCPLPLAFTVVVVADLVQPGEECPNGPCMTTTDEEVTYASAAALGPVAVILGGDTTHADPRLEWIEEGNDSAWREMYAYVYASPGLQNLLGISDIDVATWDDHDFLQDGAHGQMTGKWPALAVYEEFHPAAVLPSTGGVYQRFSHGQADFFVLDTRFWRSKAGLTDGPTKSMLGPDQLQWLLDGLAASPATWKVIYTPTSWNPVGKQQDSWALYQYEAQVIRDWVATHGITGVVLVSGDLHSDGICDDGTHSTWPECSVPPINIATLAGGGRCTGSTSCGTWTHKGTEITPHAGLLSLDFDYDVVTGAHELAMRVRAADGSVRRELVLEAP